MHMKKVRLIIPLLICISLQVFASTAENIVVDSDWLKSKIHHKNIVILQLGKAEDFEKEHIPGAVFIEWKEFTYNEEPQHFDLPSVEVLKELFESKGLNDGDLVLIYTSQNWVSLMTRLYFTLDYLGYGDKTFMLDGGIAHWKDNGGEVTAETPEIVRGSFTPDPNENLVVSSNYIMENIDNEGIAIVDGRASVYYEGIEAGANGKHRKGHIPGARTVPYTSLTIDTELGSYQFKSLKELKDIFQEQGLQKNQELVLYCHIGMQLTTVYTAAKMVGYENIRIYDGSFHEWGPDESLPVTLETK
jgi:thiosulfate/3-mercaptopyruvate sulfurtransferase